MRFVILIISFLLLISCNDKKTSEKENVANTTKQISTLEKKVTPPPVYLDSASTEKQILEHLGKRKADLESLLKDATPEEANELYITYFKENDSALWILSNRKSKLLDIYVEFMQYDEKTGTNFLVIPKEHQQEVKNIESKGVEFWYAGEGYTELRMNPHFYYKMFSGKLTPDFQRWLEISTKEEKELYAADAGILVPWKEIGDRILVREKFIKDFPNSRLVKEQILSELNDYRWDYLAGQDNTPVFSDYSDENNPKMDAEITKEFQRFIKTNPNSETTKMLQKLLKNTTAESWHQSVEKILGERYYHPGIFR